MKSKRPTGVLIGIHIITLLQVNSAKDMFKYLTIHRLGDNEIKNRVQRRIKDADIRKKLQRVIPGMLDFEWKLYKESETHWLQAASASRSK